MSKCYYEDNGHCHHFAGRFEECPGDCSLKLEKARKEIARSGSTGVSEPATMKVSTDTDNSEVYPHYFKEWYGKLDVYRVLDLFEVSNPPVQHAIKKLLCSGNRGVKDVKKDLNEAIDSILRALQMMEEEGK